MESRTNKQNIDNNSNNVLSRSSRNSKLYKEEDNKYQEFDNLPIEDNTDEIDMDSLKKLLTRTDKNDRAYHNEEKYTSILENKKRSIDENKVYDINELLEKARYENKKIQEPKNEIIENSRSILELLEEDKLKENNNINKEIPTNDLSKTSNLELTREMKFHTRNISTNPLIDQVMPDNDLSLDLLSDLKPTDDTITTKPITEKLIKENILTNKPKNKTEEINIKPDNNRPFFPIQENISDTSDIDIIKKPNDKIDHDFFTNSYEFSRKDFTDNEFEGEKSGSFLKIMLLIIAIIIFVGAIFYFILNYGINK